MDGLKISKRLQTVAEMVKTGNSVADIGTDHGYLPIYLVQNHISEAVIAMDVRKGPLSKATHNVKEYGLESKIELRLSDGLEMLQTGETQTVTICGMGGKLMKQILSSGLDRLQDGMQLILSPQSELSEFRIFLKNNHIHIMDEMMLKEENQYYVIMNCMYCPLQQKAEDLYGRKLLEKRDPVLQELLHRELELNTRVYEKLEAMERSGAIEQRIEDLREEKAVILKALDYYK